MSFKQNSMINLGNYEEYFILYMDNELPAAEKLMVEAFLAQHPHLQEELDMLMGTKLPMDAVSFDGKEELFSSSMMVTAIDENLLLYIDNELPLTEKKAVEEKIGADKDYAAQHLALMKTKLDATEKVLHPNKKELYRHTERVIVFRSWMRIAAAVILVLFGSLFFLLNKKENVVTDGRVAVKPKVTTPVTTEKNNPVEKLIEKSLPSNEETSVAQTTENKVQPKKDKTLSPTDNKVDVNNIQQPLTTNDPSLAQQQPRKREVIQFDVKRFTTQPEIGEIGVKETLAHNNVTSPITASYNDQEGTQEPADPSGDFKNTKRSSAKGLFRKVTRFIGRNTGIGVADKDADEVLIGAVALKLK